MIALQERDVDGLDRTAGAIRGRAARVVHVVTSEMDNYEPGVYTEKVLEATKLLTDTGRWYRLITLYTRTSERIRSPGFLKRLRSRRAESSAQFYRIRGLCGSNHQRASVSLCLNLRLRHSRDLCLNPARVPDVNNRQVCLISVKHKSSNRKSLFLPVALVAECDGGVTVTLRLSSSALPGSKR